MTKADELQAKVERLIQKYVKGPQDTDALTMVEEMLNQVFIDAGAAPPSRIRLVITGADTITIGFDDDMKGYIRCPDPSCYARLPETDTLGQKAHMEAWHPDILATRAAEDRRWDGWEDE